MKISTISLTDRDYAALTFGPTKFIVGYRNNPDFFYYKFDSDKYQLIWQKIIPDGLVFNAYRLSLSNDIYMQRPAGEVCQFSEELQLMRTLPSPGYMIGLLPDGRNAVVSNEASPSTKTEGVRLSVVPVSNLHAPRYHLATPDAGAYSREEELYACGRQDGRITVIARNQPFADFYDVAGK